MKCPAILILLLLYSNFTVNGQSTKQYLDLTKQFTDSIFSGIHKNHKQVILSETINASTFYYCKSILSFDTFYKRTAFDNGKTIKIDTFTFSKDERKIIDSCYSDYSNFIWASNLINDAIILSRDTVNTIYDSHAIDIDIYLENCYGDRRLFSLTKPIFLRDNSFCIFYEESDCGILCGEGSLIIYKKENEKWNPYMTLAEWVE